MSRRFLIGGWILALILTAGASAQAGDVLDRIVATVNGHIILQSDWDDAVRYEAFIAGHERGGLPTADRKATLDRLIDQELLREQLHASDFPQTPEKEVSQRLEDVRKQYPEAASGEGWRSVLARNGLTEDGLKERIAQELDLLRLVDARLRPGVNIDGKSIESYYNQELIPQLRQAGAKDVALADVSGKIKELLTEEKVNQLLVAWLQSLRSGGDIRTTPDAPPTEIKAR